MLIHLLASFTFGATTVLYQSDEKTGEVGLELCPTSMVSSIVPRQELLNSPEVLGLPTDWRPTRRVYVDSLVQLKCAGDSYTGGFGQGRTMRENGSVASLHFEKQSVEHVGDITTVVTLLRSSRGYLCEHRLSWKAGDAAFTVRTLFHNVTAQPITLEMLSSFSMGGVSPFDPGATPGRLILHQFRSSWSAEGRLVSRPFEELQLEPAWIPANASAERFGQVGSTPVNGYFPFVAVEDKQAHVIWGAQVSWPGSWQMEVYRRNDCAAISGGLADREFGHWLKEVRPGGSFEGPLATIATVQGDIDDLCDSLTSMQKAAADHNPQIESSLPIVCNEWCTSWGSPTEVSLTAMAERLKGTPTKYLVIDAGWYRPAKGAWSSSQGDWIPNTKMFPHGMAAIAQVIRDRGIIPGIWFEMEDTGSDSAAFKMTEHQLKRDGFPILAGGRHFWDMRDPFVTDYLDKKVIGLLRDSGFGYIKVDYNESIGIGADGTESLGETLRQNILGTQDFFRKMRAEVPDLVVENCASGGHRLEPSMLGLTAMSSFSDAHETEEIPIIAANLHRLMLPRQSQIWAVLHRTDTAKRLNYSLASTFLGRMCLSGEITNLDPQQWEQVLRAEGLYTHAAPTIKEGQSRRFGPAILSWRHPVGWQAVARRAGDGKHVLVVAHTFAGPLPGQVEIPLPQRGAWKVTEGMNSTGKVPILSGDSLIWSPDGEFDAAVVLLEKNE